MKGLGANDSTDQVQMSVTERQDAAERSVVSIEDNSNTSKSNKFKSQKEEILMSKLG